MNAFIRRIPNAGCFVFFLVVLNRFVGLSAIDRRKEQSARGIRVFCCSLRDAASRRNITDEFAPFDIWLAKGIRTNIQLALFAEQTTVADLEQDLDEKWVHSYGAGIRLEMASGFVFRLDGVTGEEGFQTQLFLNYPWGLFN